jgi:hypothetical protein
MKIGPTPSTFLNTPFLPGFAPGIDQTPGFRPLATTTSFEHPTLEEQSLTTCPDQTSSANKLWRDLEIDGGAFAKTVSWTVISALEIGLSPIPTNTISIGGDFCYANFVSLPAQIRFLTAQDHLQKLVDPKTDEAKQRVILKALNVLGYSDNYIAQELAHYFTMIDPSKNFSLHENEQKLIIRLLKSPNISPDIKAHFFPIIFYAPNQQFIEALSQLRKQRVFKLDINVRKALILALGECTGDRPEAFDYLNRIWREPVKAIHFFARQTEFTSDTGFGLSRKATNLFELVGSLEDITSEAQLQFQTMARLCAGMNSVLDESAPQFDYAELLKHIPDHHRQHCYNKLMKFRNDNDLSPAQVTKWKAIMKAIIPQQ